MNEREAFVATALTGSGYEVLRNGWPDFMVVSPAGRAFGLEWKALETRDVLRANQWRMHELLGLAGLPTLVTGSLTQVFGYLPPEPEAAVKAALRSARSHRRDEIDQLDRQIAELRAERAALLLGVAA